MDEKDVTAFRSWVFRYYTHWGRHGLPWRLTQDPYAILVSEIMLQQTQVERVTPKYERFLQVVPTWQALAELPVPQLLELWQGLGYNRRALNLQRAAQYVVQNWGGQVPQSPLELQQLPGIGPYTASAVAAFAFNQPVTMLETNIRRIFLYHFFAGQTDVPDSDLQPLLQAALPAGEARTWHWALMDYGAFLGKALPNANTRSKHYAKQSTFAGSHRQLRGRILKALLEPQQAWLDLKASYPKEQIQATVQELIAEGFPVQDLLNAELR